MNSEQTSKQQTSPLEAAALKLDEELRASGRTVTVDSGQSDGPEYQVMFPANRESEQNLSESPSNMSQDSSSAQDESMVPAMDSLETTLQAKLRPQEQTDEKGDGEHRIRKFLGGNPALMDQVLEKVRKLD